MILPPKHATLEHISTKQPRRAPASWHPVNRIQHPRENMLTPPTNPPKKRRRRPSLSETDESPSIDAAIDIFQKSQSSIMVSLPPTGCFDTLIQRVEETMALEDKRGISLAHKAKRRMTIAMRLSERKGGEENNLPLGETGRPNNTSHILSSGLATTYDRSTDRIQKQPHLVKPKWVPATTNQFSPMFLAMISEAEAEIPNKNNTTLENVAQETSQPETLVVEREYSPLTIRIVRAPGRSGGYIIANCRDGDWMLELGVRLEREEREREIAEREIAERKIEERERCDTDA